LAYSFFDSIDPNQTFELFPLTMLELRSVALFTPIAEWCRQWHGVTSECSVENFWGWTSRDSTKRQANWDVQRGVGPAGRENRGRRTNPGFRVSVRDRRFRSLAYHASFPQRGLHGRRELWELVLRFLGWHALSGVLAQ